MESYLKEAVRAGLGKKTAGLIAYINDTCMARSIDPPTLEQLLNMSYRKMEQLSRRIQEGVYLTPADVEMNDELTLQLTAEGMIRNAKYRDKLMITLMASVNR